MCIYSRCFWRMFTHMAVWRTFTLFPLTVVVLTFQFPFAVLVHARELTWSAERGHNFVRLLLSCAPRSEHQPAHDHPTTGSTTPFRSKEVSQGIDIERIERMVKENNPGRSFAYGPPPYSSAEYDYMFANLTLINANLVRPLLRAISSSIFWVSSSLSSSSELQAPRRRGGRDSFVAEHEEKGLQNCANCGTINHYHDDDDQRIYSSKRFAQSKNLSLEKAIEDVLLICDAHADQDTISDDRDEMDF